MLLNGCYMEPCLVYMRESCRHLVMYPRGRPDSTKHVALYLTCTGSLPEEVVYFQLLIQNQDDEEKTCHRGSRITSCLESLPRTHISAHQTPIRVCANADLNRVFATSDWGHSKLLSTEALFDVNSGFVKDRELVVGVHISVMAAVGIAGHQLHLESASLPHSVCLQDHNKFEGQAAFPSPSMSEVFETHFDDASTCDVTVKGGATKIHAHKIVLIAQSAMFRAMFQVITALYYACCSYDHMCVATLYTQH